MKAYPSYKDSGVPWLGDVPEHWEIHPLRRIAKNIIEITNEKNLDELYVALEHIESKTGYLKRNRKKKYNIIQIYYILYNSISLKIFMKI